MIGGKATVSSRFVSEKTLQDGGSGAETAVGEEYDPRSLFEKLQAQKEAKDAKYDDMYKLSNQFRGIDEAESEFLATLDEEKKLIDRQKAQQELEQLQAFRSAQATSSKPPATDRSDKRPKSPEKSDEPKKDQPKKKRKHNPSALGIVKKKNTPTSQDAKKAPLAKPSNNDQKA